MTARRLDILEACIRLLGGVARAGEALGRLGTDPQLDARQARAVAHMGGGPIDPFGFDPDYVRRVLPLLTWLYRHYFRVEAHHVERIPEGRCLLVANHSGQIPFDGAMLAMAAFLEREPPRVVRALVERFVPSTPFVSPFLARCGQILGTPENCRRLLEESALLQVFPEGVRGLNKTYDQAYKLQRFGHGFMRLAIQTGAPVVPVVVIGAEEQAPSIANLSGLGRILGLPALPLTLTPLCGLLPLPTRYRIYFGEPMHFDGEPHDEDAFIRGKVAKVRRTMQRMIASGLAARQTVFW